MVMIEKINKIRVKAVAIFATAFQMLAYKSPYFTDTNSVICKIIVGRANAVRPYEMFSRICRDDLWSPAGG